MDAAIEIDNKRDGEHEYGCRYRYRYGYAFGLRFRFRPIAENCSDCARQTPVGNSDQQTRQARTFHASGMPSHEEQHDTMISYASLGVVDAVIVMYFWTRCLSILVL